MALRMTRDTRKLLYVTQRSIAWDRQESQSHVRWRWRGWTPRSNAERNRSDARSFAALGRPDLVKQAGVPVQQFEQGHQRQRRFRFA